MADTGITRAELDARLDGLRAAINQGFDHQAKLTTRVVDRLDAINGRVRTTERDLAVLEGRAAALRGVASRWSAIVSAIVSGGMAWVLGKGDL